VELYIPLKDIKKKLTESANTHLKLRWLYI